METIKTSAIRRNLKEAYDHLLNDQGCYSDDINRFEVLSAWRISTEFQVADATLIRVGEKGCAKTATQMTLGDGAWIMRFSVLQDPRCGEWIESWAGP